MSNEDGGPAFPSTYAIRQVSPDTISKELISDGGLTIRDWFAGMALQGIIASPVPVIIDGRKIKEAMEYAQAAYGFADAMLEARKK